MVEPSPEELTARPDDYGSWTANKKRQWTNQYRKANPRLKDAAEDPSGSRTARARTAKDAALANPGERVSI
ncbi:hypothetical protein PUNSTDRAFT_128999 [Punctularia strigosozonata HHB-11173 SS5]|uniref:uncharacterized protein n=1 Tax=Punctularia strigosozonata (strain HHB-11173) TaxID=741275 RepID=UPI00044179E5|nr:uncharacterized protein PUNSTDRAFT_128999 [Punctularia strigosozonata HHB-11173 SS5]EIN13311.1 hypothetical protein PUNSTDRAFT_128999 [Punctularia strigosozonata HHB-11173 SS5]